MDIWPRCEYTVVAPKHVSALALASGALCFALFLLRAFDAISFTEPLHLLTSGDEVSSLFGVWRKANGFAVYTDRFHIPFNAIFFNWLFYESYGAVVRVVLGGLGLGDVWLPTVARMFSLLAVTCAGVCAWLSFPKPAGAYRALAAPYALVLAMGPLVGWWALTVRPDLWAFALETAAAAAFLRLYGRQHFMAIVAVAVLGYAAWSFKQIDLYVPAAAGLFLLIRRDWVGAGFLVALMSAFLVVTLVVSSPQYLRTIFFSGIPLRFEVGVAVHNLGNFAIKCGPTLAGVGVLGGYLLVKAERWRVFRGDALLFACTGLAISLIAIAASAQSGAAENYLFTLSYFLSLFTMAALTALEREGWRLPDSGVVLLGVGWLSLAGAVLAVLTGTLGVVSLSAQSSATIALKKCVDVLPRPVLVRDPYLSLPWMTPGTTPFVLSYVYDLERSLGKPFEAGGIGGLVASGAFAAIFTSREDELKMIDGGSTSLYEVSGSCQKWPVLLLRR